MKLKLSDQIYKGFALAVLFVLIIKRVITIDFFILAPLIAVLPELYEYIETKTRGPEHKFIFLDDDYRPYKIMKKRTNNETVKIFNKERNISLDNQIHFMIYNSATELKINKSNLELFSPVAYDEITNNEIIKQLFGAIKTGKFIEYILYISALSCGLIGILLYITITQIIPILNEGI